MFSLFFISLLSLTTFADAGTIEEWFGNKTESLRDWFGNLTELPTKYATATGEVVCQKGSASIKVPGVEVSLKADGLIPRKKYENTEATDVDGHFNLTSVMQAKWRHSFKIHVEIACSDDRAMKVVTDRCPEFFKSLDCSKICKLILNEEIPDAETYDSPTKSRTYVKNLNLDQMNKIC